MGAASSLQSKQESFQRNRPTRKSTLREDFHREFGDLENKPKGKTSVDSTTSSDGGNTETIKNTTNLPAVLRAKNLFMKPIATKRGPKENLLLVKKQDNTGLLKEIYRRLDPKVAVAGSKHVIGEVETAIKYKTREQKLLVKVSRVKNLSNESLGFSEKNPDPYVKVDLWLSGRDEAVESFRTKVKNNTCNPVFQEIFQFDLPQEQVAAASLHVSVWDKDMISLDDFMGECNLQLCSLDLNDGGMVWNKLLPQTDFTITGSMSVSVTFQEPNRLSVNIHRASGLKVANVVSNSSDPYVRLYVTGLPQKEQTKVINNSLDPVWDERKDFTIHPDEFSRRTIVLNVMDKEIAGSDKRLGDVHIPLSEFNLEESGLVKSYELKDLRNSSQARSKWSEEGLAMEFKEAMRAHAIYGYPKFLFKKQHKGQMLVSVQSTKARAQAKMVITNGIPTASAS